MSYLGPVVALVRYKGQPEEVFSVFVEWQGLAALNSTASSGAFIILRTYQYQKEKEPLFVEALGSTTARYENDRKTRITDDLKRTIRTIDNVLIPIY